MTNMLTFLRNRKEILGINDRYFSYQFYNRGKRKVADDKLLTKKILKKNEVAIPELYGTIKNFRQLEKFNFEKLPNSFVLKPARGLKGAGINIYYNRAKDGSWILADRSKHSIEDIKIQVANILEGQFSSGINPEPDVAIFEERVKMHNAFKLYSYRGVPDIRIITYNLVPIMAMLRLPTEESEGKANISRGAIGVGIDMSRGVTTTAIKNGRAIENVPGTNLHLSGIKIPYWSRVLKLSAECQRITGLNYLGVDIIIDRDKGPMVVELNSRPGLGIQLANQVGLKDRLRRVEKLKNVSVERAVRLSKDLFGGEIDESIENISGREVIGIFEEVTLIGKNGKEIKVKCKIDTGAQSSSIDTEIALELGYKDVVLYFSKVLAEKKNENLELLFKEGKLDGHNDLKDIQKVKSALGNSFRIYIDIECQVREKKFIMRANVADRADLSYPALLGKNDLKEFLIDVTRGA